MSNMKNAPEMTASPKIGAEQKDAPALVKKIGKTTYVVRVHFSETSKETMSDKIKRMLKNEVEQM
nr:transposon-encoded TnpW family protein [Acutalibacter sp. 1XD8-36]